MDRSHWLQKEFEMLTLPAHPTSDLKITIVRILRMHLVSVVPVMSKSTLNPSVQLSQAGSYSANSLGLNSLC